MGTSNTFTPFEGDEKKLRIAAGTAVDAVFNDLSSTHARDNDYFGHMAEFVSSLLTLGLMRRFKSEGDFREMLEIYLSSTASEEQQDLMWKKAQFGFSSVKNFEADPAPVHLVRGSALDALRRAERFMAGFEGDELQEGIDADLNAIRAAIAEMEV